MQKTTKSLVPGGHEFALDEDGDIDIYDNDNHGGPWCRLCSDSWCMWCDPDRMQEKCPAKQESQTLPGLEYD